MKKKKLNAFLVADLLGLLALSPSLSRDDKPPEIGETKCE